jgi:thiamine transport system substrate-binding protein
VTPIDFGFVTLNMDPAAGDPPQSLAELTEAAWEGKLVVEDPATSSPGLQFLAQTVVNFGEGGWQDFWRALRANDVLVAGGWTDAYYTQFSFYDGPRPLVVSYTSSPAAEAFFGELAEPPTVNVNLGQLVRQVEAAGVLEGADEPELAREFIDFMLSDEFQAQIPGTMFVYPVIPGVATPDWWRWAEVNFQFSDLSPEPEEVERWVAEWTAIMRR